MNRLLRIFVSAIITLSCAISVKAEIAPTIYGSVIYSPTWGDNAQYGMYSFPATGNTQLTQLANNPDLVSNGGGVLFGGNYLCISYYKSFYDTLVTYAYVFDTENWSKKMSIFGKAEWISTDMTYCATDDKIYGCFVNSQTGTYEFGTLDVALGETSYDSTISRTTIAPLDEALNGIAADKAGKLYAITQSGKLVTVDKETGALTEIGDTGVVPKYNTSATFDERTNTLYWLAMTEDKSSTLYKVDLATAALTKVSDMPNNEEVCGMYIPVIAADNAPAAATNANAVFANGERKGIVSFTVPTTTYAENPLTGTVNYRILANSQEAAPGQAQPGQNVEQEVIVDTDGEYTFTIILSNAEGNSPKVKTQPIIIGKATPKAPTNVILTKTSANTFNIKWDAVTEGTSSGYFDPAQVTYNVIRINDNTTIATNLTGTETTDNVTYTDITSFQYKVSAKFGDKESEFATSNNIVLGSVKIPWVCNFDKADDFNKFSVIDVAKDGKTWKYSYGLAEITYDSANPKDDYLTTPPLSLKAGMRYKLTYSVTCASSSYPEKMELKLGSEPTIDGLTKTIVEERVYDNAIEEYETHFFSVSADGDYYLSWHATSDAGMYSLRLDNIEIVEDAMVDAPAEVEELSISVDDTGFNPTIAFKAPSKTIGGDPLTAIEKTEIIRQGTLIKPISNPTPGTTQSFTDTESSLQGVIEYSIVSYNEYGKGATTSKSIYVGYDVPTPPTNIILTDNFDGTITLTWEAPTEGINGGKIGEIKYDISANYATEPIRTNFIGNTITLTPQSSNQQAEIRYEVIATNAAGNSTTAQSETILFGTPYKTPFEESFADAKTHNNPWTETHEASYATWTVGRNLSSPKVEPQDLDGGLIYYSCSYYTNYHGILYSPKIDISTCKNPTLSFYIYKTAETNAYLKVAISADNGDYVDAKQILIKDIEGENGWVKINIPLTDYKTSKFIRASFDAWGLSSYSNVILDNIRVFDMVDYDLSVGITAPKSIKLGETATISVNVKNEGTESVTKDDYSVELYINDKLFSTSNGIDLPSESTGNIDFEYTSNLTSPESLAIYAKVVMAKDEIQENNQTAEVSTEIIMPRYPVAEGLTATQDNGKVYLTWTAPASTTVPAEPIVESFEEYQSFIIDNIGDWTTYDGDQAYTNGITGAVYDNAGEKMAYQVFAPDEVSGSQLTADRYKAHTGNKYAVAWCSLYSTNNDWLISPKLPGIEQEIEFWVGSINQSYGNESYEVLYSTTDNNPDSFTKIDEASGEADQTWKKATAKLPDGSKYFAIRCTSPDRYAFKLDDIKYISAASGEQVLTISGYNIYRNDEQINSDPVIETEYTDNNPLTGNSKYNVTVAYTIGESIYSNDAYPELGSVETGLSKSVKAYGADEQIKISGAEGQSVNIYTLSGSLIYSQEGTNTMTINVQQGIYIVKIGCATIKVSVR